jgi:hypothetical protein
MKVTRIASTPGKVLDQFVKDKFYVTMGLGLRATEIMS